MTSITLGIVIALSCIFIAFVDYRKRGIMRNFKSQQGFTLIELMFVVGIIGFLASIAIPVYQGYVVRAKVIEGLALAASAKAAVSENAASGNDFASGWSAPSPTAVVSKDPQGLSHNINDSGVEIDSSNGVITITYTNKIASGSPTLKLVPVDGGELLVSRQVITSDMIDWQCNSAEPPLDNLFRDTKGTLEAKFVPANCRT